MFLLLGLIFICGAYAQDYEKVGQSPVQQYFNVRCLKNAKQGDAYDQLVGLSYDFYKYAEYTATFLPLHVDHFCKDERPILTLKLRDVNKQLGDCMPPEEKFLPKFVQDTFVDFLNFLCAKNGAHVKTFFSSHGKDCRATMSRNNASLEVGACFSRVFSVVDDKAYMTKTTLCRDLGLVKGCFIGILDRYCPDFAAFKELNNQFFSYITQPCSSGNAISSFGLGGLLISVCAVLFYGKLL